VKRNHNVLIVDDSEEFRTMLRKTLSRHGYSVESAASAEEALSRVETSQYDAAVVDLVMPGRDGADLTAALRSKFPGLPILMLTAFTHSPLITAAQRSGAKVLTKPVPIQEIVDFLQREIG
jgi:two-component system nitrogen regulation response regulator GlnG